MEKQTYPSGYGARLLSECALHAQVRTLPSALLGPWGCSSDGRALAQHARGTGIDTLHLHLWRPWAFSSVVERPFCIRKVEGSNPSSSSTFSVARTKEHPWQDSNLQPPDPWSGALPLSHTDTQQPKCTGSRDRTGDLTRVRRAS